MVQLLRGFLEASGTFGKSENGSAADGDH